MKSIAFIRSSVIDIEDMMTSICPAFRAGMMPSQAVGVMTHSSAACLQIAFMKSTSQPTQAPEASGEVKGG